MIKRRTGAYEVKQREREHERVTKRARDQENLVRKTGKKAKGDRISK